MEWSALHLGVDEKALQAGIHAVECVVPSCLNNGGITFWVEAFPL